MLGSAPASDVVDLGWTRAPFGRAAWLQRNVAGERLSQMRLRSARLAFTAALLPVIVLTSVMLLAGCAKIANRAATVAVRTGVAMITRTESPPTADLQSSRTRQVETTGLADEAQVPDGLVVLASRTVAIGWGAFANSRSELVRPPVLITNKKELLRYIGQYRVDVRETVIASTALSKASAALAKGDVLLGAVIHTSCFPAGKPAVTLDGGVVRIIPTEFDPAETDLRTHTSCDVAIGTVAIVAMKPADLPMDSLRLAADLPIVN